MRNSCFVNLPISIVSLLLLTNHAIGSHQVNAATKPAPFTEEEIVSHVFTLTKDYLRDFQHSQTHVLYGARLSTKKLWTSPEDIKKELPKPWGYGSRIADTGLHCGHLLVAMLDAYAARPDPMLKKNIADTFAAIKLIGSLPETHPKPNKPALIGLVPRGPHPDDMSAYFDDSSMDQHTTYIISLARYAKSSLASKEEKVWIRKALGQVGRRLEKNGWSIKRADGKTQAHVGFAWTGFSSDHASILLPAIYGLYMGTDDKHWLTTYEKFLAEKKGLRWKRLHPGSHVKINGHPIYANQNAFRVNALFQMETDKERKTILRGLLKQTADMQMQRDFPGPMYLRFHSSKEWAKLRKESGWKDDNLHGCNAAWNNYQPAMLNKGGLPVLAHVRFPLGGFHMVMLSENSEMIQQNLPQIWKMLTTVDLNKIDAGETNYLFTVVALHTYAFYFQHQKLFSEKRQPKQIKNKKQDTELTLIKDVGIGATMDVATVGTHAFAIGRRKLSILDIANPTKPHVVGTLSGLGHVRQIIVNNNIAYITSREDGLFVVSVKDRKRPQLLSHYDTIEFATGIAISGNVLFVACRNYGVELIDITTPSKPIHLSTVRTGEAQSVVARGRWLYVGVWATSEVVTVDIINPRRPIIKSRVRLDGFGDGVDLQGKYLFAATGHHSRKLAHRTPDDPGFGNGHGLEIFDVTNPASPQFVSRIKFPRLYNMGNDMWGVTVAGNHAFVADTHNGIFVVDITNKKHPAIVGHRKLPSIKSKELHAFVGGLALTKDVIYVAGGETDLHVVAAPNLVHLFVKETAQPLTIPSFQTSGKNKQFQVYRTDGQVHAVNFYDDRAVVACGSAGVHVVEVEPTIKLISKLKTNGFVTDVAVSQKRVLVAAGTDGLLICKMTQQGELVQLGKYHVKGKAIKQVEVPLAGKYVLVQVGANNLHIVDISNPTLPQRVLDAKRHGLLYGDQMMRGVAENRYACVFWHVSGLHWFDMKSKTHPTSSGDNIPLRIGSVNGLVEYQGKTLATTRGGYLLLDRQDRRPIKEFKVQRISKLRHHLGTPTIYGRMLYTANRVTGTITITDISNITKPKLIQQFTLPGNPARVVIHKGTMIIPDGYHGLLIAKGEK